MTELSGGSHERFFGGIQANGTLRKEEEPMNYVYLLRCSDGSLYCGWTTDLPGRIAAHMSGRGAKYTRSRLPVRLAYYEEYEDRHEALSREWHIKRLGKSEKEALAASFRARDAEQL